MQLSAVRDILQRSPPTAATQLLSALGWDADGAGIEIPPDAPRGYARLSLRRDTTSAGTQLGSERDMWWVGFLQGASYHLAVTQGEVRWYDFDRSREWRAKEGDDLRPLKGLTPQAFVASGTFAPIGAITDSSSVPKRPPREYLTDVIRTWLVHYVGDEVAGGAGAREHEDGFVRLIARLVFIRTIEDTRSADWLEYGTLRAIADGDGNAGLKRLFKKLSTRLQSQLFTGDPIALPRDEMTRQLLTSLYGEDEHALDFAAVDFNMIGRFYEYVMGEHFAVTESMQLSLLGSPDRELRTVSHRRDFGQYYTPRVYSDYIARKVVLPKARLADRVEDLPVVADIASGSGEMLTAAFRAILSLSKFRTAEAVREILRTKFVAIDLNPTAVHLCSLNLLRTAYLACPDLVDVGLPLPMVGNMFVRDSLRVSAFEGIPKVDAIVMNPPFRGQPDWRHSLPESPSGLMALLQGKSNRATAFFIKALELLKRNGTVGCVLPTQFFVTGADANVRRRVLEVFAPTDIVINHGAEVFDGVDTQPGIVIGRFHSAVRPPGVTIATLAPPAALASAAAETGLSASPSTIRVVAPQPKLGQSNWLWDDEKWRSQFTSPLCTLGELMSNGKLSRAPMPHIKALKGLWSLRRTNRGWTNDLTGSVLLADAEPWVVVAARAGDSRSHMDLESDSDADAEGDDDDAEYVFYPYDSDHHARPLEWWSDKPSAFNYLSRVCSYARGQASYRNPDHETYRSTLASGAPQYFRPFGYHRGLPVLLLGRMAFVRFGEEHWPGMGFTDTGRVPVAGVYGHTVEARHSAVLPLILNTRFVFDQLRARAPAVQPGGVEMTTIARSILVPDIRAKALAFDVARLLAAREDAKPAENPNVQAELLIAATGLWGGQL